MNTVGFQPQTESLGLIIPRGQSVSGHVIQAKMWPKWIDREELGLGTRQCKRCIHSWTSLEAEYSLQRIITLHLWPLNKPRTIKLDYFCVLSMQYKSSLRALHTFLDFFRNLYIYHLLLDSFTSNQRQSLRSKGKKYDHDLLNHNMVSSFGRASVFWAGGRGFKSQPGPTSSPGRFSLALKATGKAPWGRGWARPTLRVFK